MRGKQHHARPQRQGTRIAIQQKLAVCSGMSCSPRANTVVNQDRDANSVLGNDDIEVTVTIDVTDAHVLDSV